MSRLIDADEFLNREIKRCHAVPLIGTSSNDNYDLRYILNSVPTVDAVPVVHGRWIGSECTECHEDLSYYQYELPNANYPFCPFCGAKMDGERKENA